MSAVVNTAAADASASQCKEDLPRHLLFKGVAGLLLGFPLALLLSWLCMYTGLGPRIAPARDQVAMWLVVPLWCAVLSLSFLADSRIRCIAWLVAWNLVAAAAWWVLQ